MSNAPRLETSDALLAAGVSKPVFDCRWPETRAIVSAAWAEGEMLQRRIYDQPYAGGQDLMQVEFVDAWLRWSQPVVALDHSSFRHRYATAGSSEAIRDVIAAYSVHRWRLGAPPVLHLFAGDYEGYAAVADAYGCRVVRHDRTRWRESFAPGEGGVEGGHLVILSAPSAIDGNLWSDLPGFLEHLENVAPGVRVAVDLAYVGAVGRDYRLDLTSPLIDTVFFSLSKVFGVYYQRIGGVLSREPLPGLAGTRFFKNTLSLEIGMRLLSSHPPRALAQRYAALQAEAVRNVRALLGTPIEASDVVLIGSHPWHDGLPEIVAPLRRGEHARYCLTPALDRMFATSATRDPIDSPAPPT